MTTKTYLSTEYFRDQLNLLFLQAKQERDKESYHDTERYKELDFITCGICELSDRLERGDL